MPPREQITSRDNQHLVAARKVRDGKDETRIFIEGKRLAAEAFRSDLAIESVFVSEDLADDDLFRDLPDDKIFTIGGRLLHSIADTKSPQGIAIIAERPAHSPPAIEERLRPSLPLVLFLYEISDPSNLGAVMRTAEAAGAAGIFLSPSSADPYSPKALRASMGSAFRLPVVGSTSFEDALSWAAANKLTTTAADVGGEKDYTKIEWTVPRLLILGSEAHGLQERDLERVEDRITIPMADTVESLNLAVSAGVLLFEAKRQNGG